ncbi:MAG: CHAT domain-containing protein [Saprospiraceae bacterium]|nr:CHAT domain-containing protein [Saprospiraceae bacterium]
MRKTLPFLLLIGLFIHPSISWAQKLTEADIVPLLSQANTYAESADYESGDKLLAKALNLILQYQADNDSLLGLTYFMISKTKHLNGEWEAAAPNMKRAAEYYEKAYGTLSSQNADAVYSLGKIYFDVNEDVDSAYHYLYAALDLYVQMDKKLDIGWNHRAIGTIQAFTKDYAGALASCELAVEYLQAYREECEAKEEPISRSYYLQIGQAYLLMAELYAAINDEERSILLAQRAWQIVEEKEEVHKLMRYYVLNNQAQFHAHRGDYRAALASYQLLLDESEGEKAPSERRVVYKEMAQFYSELKEYEEALDFHQQILDLNTVIQAKDSLHYAETYLEMAKIYRLQADYEKAERFVEDAYSISTFHKKQWRISNAAAEKARLLDQLGKYQQAQEWMEKAITPSYPPESSLEMARLLADQAKIFFHQYQQGNQLERLEEAEKQIDKSLSLIQLFTEETFKRRDFIKEQLNITELALQIKLALYESQGSLKLLEEGFALSESAKVNTLRLTLRENQGAQRAKIPAEIIEQEKVLKGKLAIYRERLHYVAQQNQTTESQRHQWQDSVFLTSTALQALKEQLEREYADYYHLKYDNQSISIDRIQKQLQADEALLEYFVGDEYLFVFLVTPSHVHWQALEGPTAWSENLLRLRNEVMAGGQESEVSAFGQLAHTLYQQVMGKLLSELPEHIKQLTIVPDGLLNLLPFEILFTSPGTQLNSFSAAPYLLKDYTLSYAYSATWLWSDWKKRKRKAEKELGAFAANYETYQIEQNDTLLAAVFQDVVRSGYLPLPGAEKEVQDIAAIFEAEPFLRSEATKSQFEAVAAQYQILHLAMHALIEENAPQFSKLLFTQNTGETENGQLSAQELYNYDLEADLVVLSACNTGLGKMKRGEGLMSLSHAFALAGVPATVMSLWKIPDQTTPALMVRFYQNLKDGLPKNEALRKAKLDYLQETKLDQLAHPYYWAGFMLMGDTKPLSSSWIPTGFWYGLIIILIGFGLYFYFPKNRESSPSAGS